MQVEQIQTAIFLAYLYFGKFVFAIEKNFFLYWFGWYIQESHFV